MSHDELIDHVPPIARYRREPLEDDWNAASYWDEASKVMVELDDEQLLDQLVCEDPETRVLEAFPTAAGAERVHRFLEDNRRALDLLRAGVRCGRLQFPEPEEEETDFAENVESIAPLAQLAQAWFISARSQIANRDSAAAASDLIGLGQMGHMMCCGEGLMVHYLVGTSITAMALMGMRLLVTGHEVTPEVRADLSDAVGRWLAKSGEVGQCLRVDLCCHALRELDRLPEAGDVDALVDRLLDRHYSNAPMLAQEEESRHRELEDDGRLAWRRQRILYLVAGHPAPWNKIDTARLMGRQVADRIRELGRQRWFDLSVPWRRLVRSCGRMRFRSRINLWPSQLQSSFPYEYLGPSDSARRRLADLREHLSDKQWAEIQPPTDADLEAARGRLQSAANPLGVLVADALLAIDITGHERLRRHRLLEAKSVLGLS
jgi:hypothetical protein